MTDYPERLYGESVSLSWATPGQKTVTVVVSHCGGSTSTVQTVDISDPPPDCTLPITGVVIRCAHSGRHRGFSHLSKPFSLPSSATDPLTFTWDVTGHNPVIESTDQKISRRKVTNGARRGTKGSGRNGRKLRRFGLSLSRRLGR